MTEISTPYPCSIAAERAVLGCMLFGTEESKATIAEAETGDFFDSKHRLIFQAILRLRKGETHVDLVTLRDALANDLEYAGGASYLASLLDGLPRTLKPDAYLNVLRRDRARRSIIDVGKKFQIHGFEEEDAVGAARETWGALQLPEKHGPVSAGEVVGGILSEIERLQIGGERNAGIPTHLTRFDALTGGLPHRALVVVAGRPSSGKSSFLMNCAVRAARDGMRVGIISMEESVGALVHRMLSFLAQINSMKILHAKLERHEWARIIEAAGLLKPFHILIEDKPMPIGALCDAARLMKIRHGIQILMVDYLQIIIEDSRRGENRNYQVAKWTQALKHLSSELGITVCVASQLSREVEKGGRRPRLSDLRDSGAIEQDADMVVFLHSSPQAPDAETPAEEQRIVEVAISKNRHGPTGILRDVVGFTPAFTMFSDAT